MFCSRCGAPLTTGERFCRSCGADNFAGVPQQPVVIQPVAVPVAVSKKAYFKKLAPAPVKTKVNLARILGIVCLALLVLSYFVVMNTSVQNIPCLSTILGSDVVDMEQAMEELDEVADELDHLIQENEDVLEEELSKAERKELDKFVDAIRKCAKSFSIQNCRKLVDSFENLASIDETMFDDSFSYMLEVKAFTAVFDFISNILLIGALICGALLFFGGMFRLTPLVGAGFGLACVYAMLFCGLVILAVIVVSSIFLLLCTIGANKAYKEYRKNPAIIY